MRINISIDVDDNHPTSFIASIVGENSSVKELLGRYDLFIVLSTKIMICTIKGISLDNFIGEVSVEVRCYGRTSMVLDVVVAITDLVNYGVVIIPSVSHALG